MLSDYEDDVDDDLPSISLSQSTGEKSESEMPRAAEVASERAREAAAERALRELRAPARASPPAPGAAADADDGEAELLEAWSELSVGDGGGGGGGGGARAGEGRRRGRGPGGAGGGRLRVVRALRDQLATGPVGTGPLLDAYLRAVDAAPHAVDAITSQVLSDIITCVCEGRVEGRGTVAAGAWLLGVACAGGRARARRALHTLLDQHATTEQVDELAGVASAALAGLGAGGALLAAHDAARSGARGGSDRLAARLLAAARDHLLPAPAGEEMETETETPPESDLWARAAACESAWRRLPAARQLLVLRGAARALAAEPRATGTALLAALAQPLPRTGALLARQQVLSNVSKLQLLFRERTGEAEGEGGGDDLNTDLPIHDEVTVKVEPIYEHEIKEEQIAVEHGESAVNVVTGTDTDAAVAGSPSPERKRLRRSPRAHAATSTPTK